MPITFRTSPGTHPPLLPAQHTVSKTGRNPKSLGIAVQTLLVWLWLTFPANFYQGEIVTLRGGSGLRQLHSSGTTIPECYPPQADHGWGGGGIAAMRGPDASSSLTLVEVGLWVLHPSPSACPTPGTAGWLALG